MKNNFIIFDVVLLVVSLGLCVFFFQKSFENTYDKIHEQDRLEKQAELESIEAAKSLEE